MRLLLIEDEPTLRESVAKKLRRSGYEMDDCGDGETALELLAAERYDLVLLDLNLPKVNGMTVLRTLRKTDLETPVLILSARSEISDKVEGLDAGANDYLAKPFHLAELEARVRSLTRRQFIQRDVCLGCGRLTFDTKSRLAMADGQPIPLTRKESGVLEYLLLHQGRPVSQEELIEHVWDSSVVAGRAINAVAFQLFIQLFHLLRVNNTAAFFHSVTDFGAGQFACTAALFNQVANRIFLFCHK